MNQQTIAIFSGKPEAAEIWGSLVNLLLKFDQATIAEKKTCLHVEAFQGAFLGVHPKKLGLRINIVLNRELQSPRVSKCERVSKNRFHNEVDILQTDQIDEEFLAWIGEAYELRRSLSE